MNYLKQSALFPGLVVFIIGCSSESDNVFDPWPIETTETLDSEPAWSPDGKQIAYNHGGAEIWLLELETMTSQALIPGSCPDWSPDGKRIVFVKNHDIYVIDLETDEETQLTFWGQCYYPSWSPDGERIIFDTITGSEIPPDSAGIWMINLDGADMTQLIEFNGRQPDWSPGNEDIVFVQAAGASAPYTEIMILSVMDTEIERLTDNVRDDRHPKWSPCGGRIAWESYGSGNDPTSGVWVMNSDGSNQHLLASWAGRPSWSPDGSQIVYAGYNEDSDTVTLWVMNADGTDPHPITHPEDYQ